MKVSDIVNKEFTKSVLGYDVREVDLFLDQVIEQIEKLETERREMITAIEYLLAELEHAEQISTGTEQTDARRAIETAAASRRHALQPPRQIAQDASKRPKREQTQVLLEVETGVAAPRRRAVENDIQRLTQESIDEIAERVEKSEVQ
mgnify:CR=1 FL=1